MVIRGPGGKKWEHGQNRLLEVSTKEARSGSIGIHRDLGPLGIWVPTMMDPGDRGFHHQKRACFTMKNDEIYADLTEKMRLYSSQMVAGPTRSNSWGAPRYYPSCFQFTWFESNRSGNMGTVYQSLIVGGCWLIPPWLMFEPISTNIN